MTFKARQGNLLRLNFNNAHRTIGESMKRFNFNTIELIQSSEFKACMVMAGGGSAAVHALLSHAGASRFVLDVQIPYSRETMSEYLGEVPESYCCKATAQKMAKTAFEHAERFSKHALGIACTAALQTVGVREDSDRAFLCFYARQKMKSYALEFKEGSRLEQEMQLSESLIEKLAEFISE